MGGAGFHRLTSTERIGPSGRDLMGLTYDIVGRGGGLGGGVAGWAGGRMGCSVALVTMRVGAIGRMSCNPAVGGLGKGQMVREIDALGGLMALAIDRAGIQFRMLNRSKGPAVWAPRAQADRALYTEAVLDLLRSIDGIEIIEGMVDALLVEEALVRERRTGSVPAFSRDPKGSALPAFSRDPKGSASRWPTSSDVRDPTAPLRITGVRLGDGRELRCRAAVLTTGTFLRGLMHCGERQTVGGRMGEPAATALSDNLAALGLELARLKTGTPPRVHRDSVDFTPLASQPGDDPPLPFSFMTTALPQRQVECWITHTNERVHELIRANIHRAPMYSGQIKSRGPRYCPSIEDKVVRFSDKSSHQVFLEPEGYDNPLIYCNGIPTSLPEDVQEPMVHAIAGLGNARIEQYGYAIEYDWVPTDQIFATLEAKRIAGLFLAGQINGTSGYEEAAGQGLLAGINSVAGVLGREPVVLGRDEAYIGVMIDDLVTRPPDEPYRMFTSRAEYRLHLRSDNADMRLTPIGRRVGLVDDERWNVFERKRTAIESLEAALGACRLEGRALIDWLRRPHTRLADLGEQCGELAVRSVPAAALEAVEIRVKYAGYLQRERRQIERYRQLEARSIPRSFDFSTINELRHEAREKFARFRPGSLGQAARISGISPADIATLSLYVFQGSRESSGRG